MSVQAREVQNYPGSLKKPARAVYEAGRAILALAMSPARAAALSGQVYVKWDFPRSLEMSLNLDFQYFSTFFDIFCRFPKGQKTPFPGTFPGEKCAFLCDFLHKYAFFAEYTRVMSIDNSCNIHKRKMKNDKTERNCTD